MPIDDAHLMAIFQDNLGKQVYECLNYDFELRMMEVVVTNTAIRCAKLQSNHHHKHTITKHFTGLMPFLLCNQQCQSTEGRINTNQ